MVILLHYGMGTDGDDDSSLHHAAGNGAVAQHHQERQRHEQFVAALDNFPVESLAEPQTMDQLASTLGWTRTEVELHA